MASCSRYPLLFVGFNLVVFLICNPLFAHKWVSNSGKYTVEAEFVSLDEGGVKLKKEDGRIIIVPLEKLSSESRSQAKKLAARLGENAKQNSHTPKADKDAHANEPDIAAVNKFLELYRRLRKSTQLKLRDYSDAPNVEWRCFIHSTSPTGLPVMFGHLPSSSQEEVELVINSADESLPNRIWPILNDRKTQGQEPYLEVTVKGEVIRVSPAFPGDSPPRIELANAVVTEVNPAISVHDSGGAKKQDVVAAAKFLNDWKKADKNDPDGTNWLNSRLKESGYIGSVVRWRCVLQEYGSEIYANLYNAGPDDPKISSKGDGDTNFITLLVGKEAFDQWNAAGRPGSLKLPPREMIVEGKFDLYFGKGVMISDAKLVPVNVLKKAESTPAAAIPTASVFQRPPESQSIRNAVEAAPAVGQTEGHTKGVSSVAFSPDGRQILTGSYDETAILWDVASGEKVQVFKGHTHNVTSVAFNPNGREVLTGSWDKTAILWDATSGEKLRILKGHTHFINAVAFSPGGRQVLTGSSDGTAILWDVASGVKVRTFVVNSTQAKVVDAVAFSPDGSQMFTGSGTTHNRAVFWDVANGEKLRILEGIERLQLFEGVNSVAFSPNGREILTGLQESKIAILWDATSGQKVRTFEGHKGKIRSVAFSPDSHRVLTGSWDKTAILWDATSDHRLRTFDVASIVWSVAFSPNGRQILTGSDDHTAILWDIASGEKARTFGTPTQQSN